MLDLIFKELATIKMEVLLWRKLAFITANSLTA